MVALAESTGFTAQSIPGAGCGCGAIPCTCSLPDGTIRASDAAYFTQSAPLNAAPTSGTVSSNDTTLLAERNYVSGIGADGRSTTNSFWGTEIGTFTYSDGNTRQAPLVAHKWEQGSTARTATAGTAGGTVRYYFAPGAYNAAEQRQLTNDMRLWSAVANIQFTAVTDPTQADLFYIRNTAGAANAQVRPNYQADDASNGLIDRSTTGDPSSTDYNSRARVSIDSSKSNGFSRLDSFTAYAGYGVDTGVHEIGHILGLGHGGRYDGNINTSTQQQSPYDTWQWTLMSYINPSDRNAKYYGSYAVQNTDWGGADGTQRAPTDPPPQGWSALWYGLRARRTDRCRGSGPSPRRSSPSCDRRTCWLDKVTAWPMRSARLA